MPHPTEKTYKKKYPLTIIVGWMVVDSPTTVILGTRTQDLLHGVPVLEGFIYLPLPQTQALYEGSKRLLHFVISIAYVEIHGPLLGLDFAQEILNLVFQLG